MKAAKRKQRATKQAVGVRSISEGIRAIMDADLPPDALLNPKLQRAIVRERAEAVVAFAKNAVDEYRRKHRKQQSSKRSK